MWEYASLLSLLLIVLTLFYTWSVRTFDHWKKRGVVFDGENLFALVGNLKACFFKKAHLADVVYSFYQRFKDKAEFGGFYVMREPTVIPLSADMTYSFLVKDFSHFYDRGFHVNENYDILCKNLFFTTGAVWKYQRTKLSPTFTSGKLRGMTTTINDTCDVFIDYMKKFSGQEVDTQEKIGDCIMCFIGKVVCGMEYYDLENPEPIFKKICKEVNQPSLRTAFKMYLNFTSPYLSRKMKFFGQYVEDYFRKLATQSMQLKSQANGEGQRAKDFLQLITDLHEEDHINKDREGYFDMNAVIGNFFVFLIAGQETSTLTVTMLLYSLSQHPHVKQKLVDEIDAVMKTIPGEMTYDDAMKKFPYLNQVIDESQRYYPLLYALNRVCTKTYTIPGTEVTISPGTPVLIPVQALHYDPRYWTDPKKFDPDRFSAENIKKIVPGSYLPFGIGPRMCIGNRLALLDMKILLIKLLQTFQVSATPRTPKTIKFDPRQPNLMVPSEKLYLKFTLRSST